MRFILTLVAVLILNFKALAKNNSPEVHLNRVSLVAIQNLPLPLFTQKFGVEVKTAILYKMKENIIRRELSFIPKKKWMKWS